jgi:uncharacterized protein YdeI (YjbR/CyaY-like superfamily)
VSNRYEQTQAETRAQWRDWLARNHATSPGIWLVTWKKASGRPHLAYDDIVEEALAFGWVDSQPRTVDDQRSARLLTPRKPGSNWSRLNKQRVERLTAAGLMQPAGLAAVAAARANGRWTALEAAENLAEPADLAAAWTPTPPPATTGTPSPGPRAGPSWNGSATPGPAPPARPGSTVPSPTPPAASEPTSGGSPSVPPDLARRPAETGEPARLPAFLLAGTGGLAG